MKLPIVIVKKSQLIFSKAFPRHKGRPGQKGGSAPSYAQRKRDGEATPIFSRPWEQIKEMQQGAYKPAPIRRTPGKDYGADPLGDGKFRMVPSGDIVDFEERQRRLRKASEHEAYLAVHPHMTASERYVNGQRIKDLQKLDTEEAKNERRKIGQETIRNHTNPIDSLTNQRAMTPQEQVQYGLKRYGKE
jgi:hypothetical protein